MSDASLRYVAQRRLSLQLQTTGDLVDADHGDVFTADEIGRALHRLVDSGALAVMPAEGAETPSRIAAAALSDDELLAAVRSRGLSVARGEQPAEAGDVAVVGGVASSQQVEPRLLDPGETLEEGSLELPEGSTVVLGDRVELPAPEADAVAAAGAPFPRHVGGGIYELSNGEHVKGKQAAFSAQAQLEA